MNTFFSLLLFICIWLNNLPQLSSSYSFIFMYQLCTTHLNVQILQDYTSENILHLIHVFYNLSETNVKTFQMICFHYYYYKSRSTEIYQKKNNKANQLHRQQKNPLSVLRESLFSGVILKRNINLGLQLVLNLDQVTNVFNFETADF